MIRVGGSFRNVLRVIGVSRNVSPFSCSKDRIIFADEPRLSRLRQCYSSPLERTKSTISYYHDISPPALRSDTIGDILNDTAEKYPDNDYAVFSADKVKQTFKQFKDEVDRLALGLVRLGLRPGDRVGIWGPNTLEWLLTQYAVASIGAILVHINPACRTTELKHTLKVAGVKTVVAATTFKTQDYYDMIAELCPTITSSTNQRRIESESLPNLESVIMYGGSHPPGTYALDDVMTMESDEDRKLLGTLKDSVKFDQPSNIIFTSGTTGMPKGATLTHHNLVNNVRHFGVLVGLHDVNHTCCCPPPFTHIFGTTLSSLCNMAYGRKFVVPAPSFEPAATIKAIQDEKCTVLYGTPSMILALLNDKALAYHDVTSVRTLFVGASTIPQETLRVAQGIMGLEEIVVGYGLTETSPAVSVSRPDDSEVKRAETVGKVMPHTEVKVVDPTSGDTIPCGEPGEICVRGYNVMRGFWNNAEKTREVIDDQGWFHSGDIGTLDEDGYIRIKSRIKDVIIRGGANVFPAEVEDLIYTHPAVQDVQVVGVPDDTLIEEICAAIIQTPGAKTTEQEIRDFCKGKISHYKIPRYVRFVDEFPMTVSGKIQKFRLREIMGKIVN